jgi:1-phosphofructokinase
MARILTITLNPAFDVTIRLAALAPGEVNRSRSVGTHPAGKGINVARVLSDLGHAVTVSGFLGEDNAGPFDALFAQCGMTDAFVRVPGETRSNIKIAEDAGRVTDVNGPGPEIDAGMQAALRKQLMAVAPGHDAVVIAGSLPRGVEPDWLAETMHALRAIGLRVAIDTSGAALQAALRASPWLVKPNAEELAQALGRQAADDDSLQAQAAELRALGIANVVVSQGAEGVCWLGDGVALRATPPRVSVLSTVGAGDSLVAGMVHGLLSGLRAERTLALATAIAAHAVTQVGVGVRDMASVTELEQQVAVAVLARDERRGSPAARAPG